MLRKLNISMVIAAFSLAAGCVGGSGGGTGTGTGDGTGGDTGGVTTPGDSLGLAGGGSTSGGMGNTFDHDNDGLDPFAVLQRIQEQGPPEISTRMHSCQKLRYATLGNVLKQLGVNLASTT